MMTARWQVAVDIILILGLIGYSVSCRSTPEAIDNTISIDLDSTPPIINSVKVSEITEVSATITWQTDEEATSQVQCGKTSQNLDMLSKSDVLATGHSISLPSLEIGTQYHFRVISSDSYGNESISDVASFSTLSPVGCAIGNRAPDFTLKDNHGKEVSLSDSLGKFVVINFWYARCAYDELEWQYWQEASVKWPSDKVTLLGIHRNRTTESEMAQWVRNYRYTVPALYDEKGEVSDKYCIVGVPTTFFISKDGTIKYTCMGAFKNYQEIEDKLNALMGDSNTAILQMYYIDSQKYPASHVQETCTLEFNLEGPEFDYMLNAHLLKPQTEYSLVYYSSPWPTNNAATLIGSARTDGLGNLKLSGSTNLGTSLPDANDPNHPTGAKILLILSSDYDSGGKVINQWHPEKYLWPGFEITYRDTDVP
jgi:peroxiredoxin